MPGEVARTSIGIREATYYLSEPMPVLCKFEAILSRRRADRDRAARSRASVSSPAAKLSLSNWNLEKFPGEDIEEFVRHIGRTAWDFATFQEWAIKPLHELRAKILGHTLLAHCTAGALPVAILVSRIWFMSTLALHQK